jgi:hypothetical protein
MSAEGKRFGLAELRMSAEYLGTGTTRRPARDFGSIGSATGISVPSTRTTPPFVWSTGHLDVTGDGELRLEQRCLSKLESIVPVTIRRRQKTLKVDRHDR